MPKYKTITLELEPHLLKFARKEAKKYGLSLGRWIGLLCMFKILTDPSLDDMHLDVMDTLFKQVRKR